MKFNNYTHFKNYCLKCATNRNYVICDEYLKIFDMLEIIVLVLENLKDNNIIKLQKDILYTLCDYFKSSNIETVFSHMKYFINKIQKFSRREVDFYYVITSLNTMLGLGVEFEDDFILSEESRYSLFYPSKVRGLEIKEEEEKIYTINEIDMSYKNKYGV